MGRQPFRILTDSKGQEEVGASVLTSRMASYRRLCDRKATPQRLLCKPLPELTIGKECQAVQHGHAEMLAVQAFRCDTSRNST